ncbi:MAG TPA: NifU family protein [Gemmatimonadaceae bacterium]|nr:NifU family protein [Gemmatimonadaceae bacterium]
MMRVWKHAPRDDDSIEQRIRQALADMRPLLRLDAAVIELVEFDGTTGVAVLRIGGDCPDCNMEAGMLRQGIEAHLRMQVPEISAVRAV